jgi:hypothetical protein
MPILRSAGEEVPARESLNAGLADPVPKPRYPLVPKRALSISFTSKAKPKLSLVPITEVVAKELPACLKNAEDKFKTEVAFTPLIDETKLSVTVEYVKSLLVIILVVASTPFTLLVKIFPETDWVNELMNLMATDETLFTKLVKEFVVVDIELVIATIPLSTEQSNCFVVEL